MRVGNEKTTAIWKRRYEAYRSSGLSRKAFCRQYRLKPSTLDYWFARIRRQSGQQGMVELKGMAAGPAASSCLTLVTVGGLRLQIPQDCDMKLLAEVVRLLGSRS